jgi:DNA (cytosine-5)-methyltransferase 1
MYRLLDLFSGIGGFSLGLERSGGFQTVAFCEIDPYCRKVLAKHWPEVPQYDDVRTLTAERLAADGITVDAICGGFPCQDISVAGKGAGIEGERSGLWAEYARIIGELRPRYVIVENVAALLGRGLDRVLGDLAEIGYDAEWHCIPASAVGAPHRRDRLWIVAHARRSHGERWQDVCAGDGFPNWQGLAHWRKADGDAECGSQDVADADSTERETLDAIAIGNGWSGTRDRWAPHDGAFMAHAIGNNGERLKPGRFDPQEWQGQIQRQIGSRNHGGGWWSVEPDVGRVAHGVPNRAHRLRALGNAVVPQIPELIGRAILAAEAA